MPHNKFAMLPRNLALILIAIFQTLPLIHSAPARPFNLSHFLFPQVTAFTETSILPQPPHFLQGVLDAIAKKEKWALDDIRVSELDVKKVKYASVQRYEFSSRVGKSKIVLKMYDEPVEWKKLDGSSSFETLVRKLGSEAVIDSFKLEGPFELQVARDDDQLSLMLPLNTSHSGLRRIAVGKGITVEVNGAEEISITHPPDIQQRPYGSLTEILSIRPPFCTVLPPIRILGPASMVAYRTRRPASNIQTVLSSRDAIALLPDKCYIKQNYEKPRHLLSSLAFLGRVLRLLSSEKVNPNASLGSQKSRIRASTVFRFQLELERDIRKNDTYWSTLAEWRTKPIVERVRYDVAARIEDGVLKPLTIKKVRPFVDVDSFAWSSLLSNLSFTKFPPVLVPPEALTLDVKW